MVADQYGRMRARLLAAIAEHEQGLIDDAGLQATLSDAAAALDKAPAHVWRALFEADVVLEYVQDGHPLNSNDQVAPLKRLRRNLREALG
jgi:hypothetical protein